MSKIDKSMSQEEIDQLLHSEEVGRLGLQGEDYPYVVPVNFSYVEGKIYFHGAFEGKKVQLIRADPRVCFEVDTGHAITPAKVGDCSYSYRSVIVYGRARLVPKNEYETFMKGALGLFEKYTSSHVPEIKPEMAEKTLMLEMEIDEVTGKKSKDLCSET